jgi:hypothetical protein
MIRAISAFIGIVLLATVSAAAQAGDTGDKAKKSPVVVELFTSQGCSSCPPAEALLGELANRPDVIALEFHVDYWDYIGWKDAFAKPDFTERQRAYVRSLKGRYSYTPQMVIDGQTHVVGSHRDEVEFLIRKYRDMETDGPAVAMKRKGETLDVSVGSAKAGGTYDVVLVTFDKPHVTEVRRGENRGRKLTNANVVREIKSIGTWSGKAKSFDVPLAGMDGDGGCAVLVQKRGPGPVVAAAKMPFDR